jgi:hypothetical protein
MELLKTKKRALVFVQMRRFLPKWQSCAGHPAKPIVAFRSAKERPFAERKATGSGYSDSL